MTARTCLALLLMTSLSACSTAPKTADASPAPRKHAWFWPLGGSRTEDAIPYLEYKKEREAERHVYALSVRNTHPTKVIVGEARLTLEMAASESKVISQPFTLSPNETQRLIVYPDGNRLSYEVTAAFKE